MGYSFRIVDEETNEVDVVHVDASKTKIDISVGSAMVSIENFGRKENGIRAVVYTDDSDEPDEIIELVKPDDVDTVIAEDYFCLDQYGEIKYAGRFLDFCDADESEVCKDSAWIFVGVDELIKLSEQINDVINKAKKC